jgi:hypothetical protein
MGSQVLFNRLGEIVRKSHGGAFHISIISPYGESGDHGE